MSNQIQIRISKVLELLGNGQDRDAIAVYYGITKTECKELFQHPKLKGRKVKKVKVSTFVVLDDENEVSLAPTPLVIPDVEAAAIMDEEANQDAQAFEGLTVFENNDSSPTDEVTEEGTKREEKEEVVDEEAATQETPRSSWNNG
tara:strand:+ start:37884 stop:38318 length:435 start_codon:yes stop_codon:yes gene_type:complete